MPTSKIGNTYFEFGCYIPEKDAILSYDLCTSNLNEKPNDIISRYPELKLSFVGYGHIVNTNLYEEISFDDTISMFFRKNVRFDWEYHK